MRVTKPGLCMGLHPGSMCAWPSKALPMALRLESELGPFGPPGETHEGLDGTPSI